MDGLDHLIQKEVGKPGEKFTHLVGLESKGFVLGPILALRWGIPFVPMRKKGKLPGECWTVEYTTEYSADVLQIQKDAFPAGSKALLIDDLLATGGTLWAGEQLVSQIPGASCVGSVVIFEIDFLQGRKKLANPLHTLIHLED